MRHAASSRFWRCHAALPAAVRALADKNFALLRSDPRHPWLNFKRIDSVWSVRVGAHYRALGTQIDGGILSVWIGTHADYDRLIG